SPCSRSRTPGRWCATRLARPEGDEGAGDAGDADQGDDRPGELVAKQLERHRVRAGDEARRAELAVGLAAVPQSRDGLHLLHGPHNSLERENRTGIRSRSRPMPTDVDTDRSTSTLPYAPAAERTAAAMLCAADSMASLGSPSTITRSTGSVPEGRSSTRPRPFKARSASACAGTIFSCFSPRQPP